MSDSTVDPLFDFFDQASEVPVGERAEWLEQNVSDEAIRSELTELLAELEHPTRDVDGRGLREVAIGVLQDAMPGDHPESFLPKTIGDYRIVSELGRGGMGTVYLARQENPDRDVAIKVLRDLSALGSTLGRFQREATLLGRLKHPGIAQIIEAGSGAMVSEAGSLEVHFFTMEYVEGLDLKKHARMHKPSVVRRLELIAEICDAVDHAHREGVLHRDLKPSNILVDVNGRTKILDFGVARLSEPDEKTSENFETLSGQVIGTLAYMSPEQVAGGRTGLDERTDVYSLGVVAYELLAGQLPIDVSNMPIAVAAQAIQDDDTATLSRFDSQYRGDVETIIQKALAKEKDRRYASAAEMAADIRRHLQDEPITARPAEKLYRLQKLVRRNRGLAIGLALTFLVLCVGIVTSTIFAIRSDRNAERADERSRVADRRLYASSISATQLALAASEHALALRSIEQTPVRYRKWEWDHLRSLICRQVSPSSLGHGVFPVGFLPSHVPVFIEKKGSAERLVRVDTKKLILAIGDESKEPSRGIEGVISADGSRAALFDESGPEVVIFDTRTGIDLRRFPVAARTPIDFISLNKNGTIVSIMEFLKLRVIDVQTGATRCTLQWDDEIESRNKVMFAPFSERFFFAGTHVKNGFRAFTFDGEALGDFPTTGFDGAWSPSGRLVAIKTRDGFEIYDSRSLKLINRYGSIYEGRCLGIHFLDEERIITNFPDGTAKLIRHATGEVEDKSWNCGHSLACFAVDQNRESLLIGHRGGIFVATLGGPSSTLSHTSFVYAVDFSPDGGLLATADFAGTIRVWNVQSRQQVAEYWTVLWGPRMISFTSDGAKIKVASMNPHSNRYVAGHVETETIDLLTGERVFEQHTLDTHMKWLPPGAQHLEVAARSRDGRRSVKYNKSRKCLELFGPEEQAIASLSDTMGFSGVAFSNRGDRIATTSLRTGRIQIFDARSGERLGDFSGQGRDAFSVGFSRDDSRIVVGGRDGASLRDPKTGDILFAFKGHGSYVHGVGVSPDGTTIATASGDGTVRLWSSQPLMERRRSAERIAEIRRDVSRKVAARVESQDPHQIIADYASIDTRVGTRDAIALDFLARQRSRGPTLKSSRGLTMNGDSRSTAELVFSRPILTLDQRQLRVEGRDADKIVAKNLRPISGSSLLFTNDNHRAFARENIELSGSFTLEFWFWQARASMGVPLSYSTASIPNNALFLDLLRLTRYQDEIMWVAKAARANHWTHLAITVDVTAGVFQKIVDGQLVGTNSINSSLEPAGVLVLGDDQDTPGGDFDAAQAFHGRIDELRIWRSVRSLKDIRENMYAPVEPDPSKLIHYWRFDELEDLGVGEEGRNDVRDLSGQAHFDLRNGLDLGVGAPSDRWRVSLAKTIAGPPSVVTVDVAEGEGVRDFKGRPLRRSAEGPKLTPIKVR